MSAAAGKGVQRFEGFLDARGPCDLSDVQGGEARGELMCVWGCCGGKGQPLRTGLHTV